VEIPTTQRGALLVRAPNPRHETALLLARPTNLRALRLEVTRRGKAISSACHHHGADAFHRSAV
jgi:hypothetical protein